MKAMNQAEETSRIINEVISGNWIPFVTVLALIGIILGLMGIILKIYVNRNEEKHKESMNRHCKTDVLLEKVTTTQARTERLLEKYGVLIDVNKQEIHELRQN